MSRGCGGLIFNRHKWRYVGVEETGRICVKCGLCEWAPPMPSGWLKVSYDELMANVEAEDMIIERSRQSRKKALREYLK